MATRDELEAAIDANPDVIDNYLVLGDWLQEHQDPRGELIGLCRATDMDRTEDAKARIAVLQREQYAAPKYGSWDWFYGFVSRYQNLIDEDDRELIAHVLEHPSLRHLDTLDLGLGGREDDERQWLIDRVASKPRPAWRSVGINCYWSGGNDPPAGRVDVSSLWEALPRISRVFVAARDIVLGEIRSETLTSLELDGEVRLEDILPVIEGSTPNLREAVLHDAPAVHIALVKAPLLRSLTKLHLPHVGDTSQRNFRGHYPFVTFAEPADGDRYEQTGE